MDVDMDRNMDIPSCEFYANLFHIETIMKFFSTERDFIFLRMKKSVNNRHQLSIEP